MKCPIKKVGSTKITLLRQQKEKKEKRLRKCIDEEYEAKNLLRKIILVE